MTPDVCALLLALALIPASLFARDEAVSLALMTGGVVLSWISPWLGAEVLHRDWLVLQSLALAVGLGARAWHAATNDLRRRDDLLVLSSAALLVALGVGVARAWFL